MHSSSYTDRRTSFSCPLSSTSADLSTLSTPFASVTEQKEPTSQLTYAYHTSQRNTLPLVHLSRRRPCRGTRRPAFASAYWTLSTTRPRSSHCSSTTAPRGRCAGSVTRTRPHTHAPCHPISTNERYSKHAAVHSLARLLIPSTRANISSLYRAVHAPR